MLYVAKAKNKTKKKKKGQKKFRLDHLYIKGGEKRGEHLTIIAVTQPLLTSPLTLVKIFFLTACIITDVRVCDNVGGTMMKTYLALGRDREGNVLPLNAEWFNRFHDHAYSCVHAIRGDQRDREKCELRDLEGDVRC